MNELNDRLDDIFGGPMLDAPRTAVNAPASFVENRLFVEGCPDCRGSGQFRSYSGRLVGPCFKCKGKGNVSFKSSPEARQKERERAANKKAEAAQSAADQALVWAEQHAEVWAWIKESQDFDFARAMQEAVLKFGGLTDGQLAACQRCVDRHNAARKAAEDKKANAPVVDSAGIDRLKASFDKAIAYSAEKGLKMSPRITIDGITISPAKANSVNPGALYVKQHGGEYLGKIAGGKFFAVRACSDEDQTKILSFIADPQDAAKVYGQTTGTCCICNATLRSEWKHRGIGPVCAEKFGW